MDKNEYTIDRGTHFSHGKKGQPSLLSLILLLLGVILHLIHGVSVWYSFALYASAVVTYRMAYNKMKYTYMRVVFDDTCTYHIEGPDALDINKLFGVGFGNHMKYSGRFGWRSIGQQFEIFAYVHNDGDMVTKKVLTCNPNEPIELCLKISDTDYEFSASKRSGERARVKIERRGSWLYNLFAYRLYPYFGGNLTAPHNMRLEMTVIN